MPNKQFLGLCLASVSLALATSACGGGNSSNPVLTTDESATTTSSDGADTTTDSQSPGLKTGKVGETLSIDGGSGETLDVTVAGITKNLRKGEYDTVAAGNVLYGVTLIVKNTGTSLYDGSPDSSSNLILANDEQVSYSSASPPSCVDPSTIKVVPGAKRRLCVPFEIKRGATPKTFQFTFETSTSTGLGEWTLG